MRTCLSHADDPRTLSLLRHWGLTVSLVACFWVLWSSETIAQECQQMTVSSGASDWSPVSYFNEHRQQFEGLAFDVMTEVAARLDIELTILNLPFKRLLSLVESGEVDMALALYKTSQREAHFAYSEPYFTNEARVFVKRGQEFEFTRLEDLIDKKGAVPAGGSFGETFDRFAKEHDLDLLPVFKRPIKHTFFELVLNDRKDYFIADHVDGMNGLRSQGLDTAIVALDWPIDQTHVHFALSRKSPCVARLGDFNRVLKEITSQGKIRAFLQHYSPP